jgi:hypothetical protein
MHSCRREWNGVFLFLFFLIHTRKLRNEFYTDLSSSLGSSSTTILYFSCGLFFFVSWVYSRDLLNGLLFSFFSLPSSLFFSIYSLTGWSRILLYGPGLERSDLVVFSFPGPDVHR